MLNNQILPKDNTKRTNYCDHYKQRIKRAKSKPNIRRTKEFINYKDKNEPLINDIYMMKTELKILIIKIIKINQYIIIHQKKHMFQVTDTVNIHITQGKTNMKIQNV